MNSIRKGYPAGGKPDKPVDEFVTTVRSLAHLIGHAVEPVHRQAIGLGESECFLPELHREASSVQEACRRVRPAVWGHGLCQAAFSLLLACCTQERSRLLPFSGFALKRLKPLRCQPRTVGAFIDERARLPILPDRAQPGPRSRSATFSLGRFTERWSTLIWWRGARISS